MNVMDFKGEGEKDEARTAWFAYMDASPVVETDHRSH